MENKLRLRDHPGLHGLVSKRQYWFDIPPCWERLVSIWLEDPEQFLARSILGILAIPHELRDRIRFLDPLGECAAICAKVFGNDWLQRDLSWEEGMDMFSFQTAWLLKSVVEPVRCFLSNDSVPLPAGRDCWISLWDSQIAHVLDVILVCDKEIRRHSRPTLFPEFSRPDLCVYIDNVCVFRGVEQASGSLNDVLAIMRKNHTRWCYGDRVPFLLGYAAASFQVCLVSLVRDEERSGRVRVEEVAHFDLSCLRGRLTLFLALVHASTVLRSLADQADELSPLEFGDVIRYDGMAAMSLCHNTVRVTYSPDEKDAIIPHLTRVYDRISQSNTPISTIFELKCCDLSSGQAIFSLPRVAMPPLTVHELMLALVDVLEALVSLHEIGIVHRDIRWANIRKSRAQAKWFLVGFEKVALSPEPIAAGGPSLSLNVAFSRGSSAPELLSRPKMMKLSTKVDVWSVGFLILTAVPRLSSELEQIQDACLQDDPAARPSASEVQRRLRLILESSRTNEK